jgi:hypothetical protein
VFHPAEIHAREIAITDFELRAREFHRRVVGPGEFAEILRANHDAENLSAALHVRLGKRVRPEVTHSVVEHDGDQPGDHEQTKRERRAGEPDEVLALREGPVENAFWFLRHDQ